MPDMNQPNLQDILIGYVDVAWRAVEDGVVNHEALEQAIDAIYAGLLAEVIETKVLPKGVDPTCARLLDAQKAEALKRWCYGDTNEAT